MADLLKMKIYSRRIALRHLGRNSTTKVPSKKISILRRNEKSNKCTTKKENEKMLSNFIIFQSGIFILLNYILYIDKDMKDEIFINIYIYIYTVCLSCSNKISRLYYIENRKQNITNFNNGIVCKRRWNW